MTKRLRPNVISMTVIIKREEEKKNKNSGSDDKVKFMILLI